MTIAQYLIDNYYAHYKGNRMDIVPTEAQIKQAMLNHPEKIIVVRDGSIRGIAIYLTLTDETYQRIETLDISQVDVVKALLLETGKNFHFVLVAADSYKTLRLIRSRALKLNPKTFSWWNPDFKRLHKYEVR